MRAVLVTSRVAALRLGAGMAAVTVAMVAFAVVQPGLERHSLGSARWARQAACVSAASVGAWLLESVAG